MSESDDKFTFAAEREVTERQKTSTWKILIVDDEDEVHHITRLVLADFSFASRKLSFLSAHSAAEAKILLEKNSDIAVILLDVVMDGDDAGLRLVRFIRDDLRNSFVRIILRTGQSGHAPENKVILEYDINDYKEKTELTAQKLFTSLVAAIRSYKDIMTIEKSRNGLQKIIESSARLFEFHSLKKFASGVLEQLSGLLCVDRDAVYVSMAGFTVARDGDGFVVLAATGHYRKGIGKRIDEYLEPAELARVEKALKTRCSCYDEGSYVGYIETKTGSQNIIYLENCPGLSPLDIELINIYSINVAVAFENIYLNREIEENHRELIFTLGDIIERRSMETGHHVKRVSEYARLLATLHGLDEEQANIIQVASAVHDIGKVAIPDIILNKASRLDDAEFNAMKEHTSMGAQMLQFSKRTLFTAAAAIAAEHHERWDGTGYPKGLSGEAITLFARIAAIADVFDALTNKRVYRSAWTESEAVKYIESMAGSQFDPALIKIFVANIDEFLKIRNNFP